MGKSCETEKKLQQIQKEHDFERRRFERLKRLTKDRKGTITMTKHGANIFVWERATEKFYEVFLYDLDGTDPYTGWELKLFSTERADCFFLDGIQGGRSAGHGEVAMKYFFKHLDQRNVLRRAKGESVITKVWGELSPEDELNRDRQKGFYEKLGFKFDIVNMRVIKIINNPSEGCEAHQCESAR